MGKTLEYLNQLPNWLINLIAVFIVSLSGVILTFWLKAHYSAKKSFRSAFATDLSSLREIDTKHDAGVFHFLRDAYPKHEAAYLEFRHSLGCNFIAKWLLHCRWIAYRGVAYDSIEDSQYRLGHFLSESESEERQKRDEAIRLIEKLIA